MAYNELTRIAFDVVNCEDGAPTPSVFINKIAELHANGELSSTQYRNLMCYVADMA